MPTRLLAPFLVGLLALSFTSCASVKTPPVNPTPEQQAARLVELDKIAGGAVTILTLTRQVQDAEIAVYNTHTVAALTDAKHAQIQQGAKTFFTQAEIQLRIAQTQATPDATRREAVAAIVTGANEFLALVAGTDNQTLNLLIASATAAILAVNLAV